MALGFGSGPLSDTNARKPSPLGYESDPRTGVSRPHAGEERVKEQLWSQKRLLGALSMEKQLQRVQNS